MAAQIDHVAVKVLQPVNILLDGSGASLTPGQVVELPAPQAAQLAGLGIVEWAPPAKSKAPKAPALPALAGRHGSIATESAPTSAPALRYAYELVADEHRERLKRAAQDIIARRRRAVDDMIEIGKQLEWAKSVLEHGQFTEWAQIEFGMSRGSIEEYRYIAARFEGKRSIIDHLTPTTARLLAAPSVPAAALEAVLEASQAAGRPLAVKEVQHIKKVYMPAPEPKRAPSVAPKALPAPEPDDDAIDADYTVIEAAPAAGTVQIQISRDLAEKLRDGLVHRIFRAFFDNAESDELLIALSAGLKRGAIDGNIDELTRLLGPRRRGA